MTSPIHVHLLPDLSPPERFAGKLVVVIDVLRATTTIVTALARGAAEVLPCLEVEDARRLAAERPGLLLGGERGGTRIDRFDLGNSPDEYTQDRVRGRTIAFTTTNGTRAMQHCRSASRILLAAFVNLSAVVDCLHSPLPVEIVCAGTGGEVSREDVLLAGAIVQEVGDRRGSQEAALRSDEAEIAGAAWRDARANMAAGASLAGQLRVSRGGRNLIRIGRERDIEIAAMVDRFEVVPELDTSEWVIR